MKTRHLIPALVCCFSLAGAVLAQTPGGKSTAPAKTPADLAFDNFNKARGAGGAKDQAFFQKVINAGMSYLAQYPTHGRVNEVVNNLAFFALYSIDKKQAAARTSYVSLLKLEIANLRYKDGVTDDTKAALAALDAAVADFEVREAFNRDNLASLREKIDAVAEAPGGGRFLVERERSYVHILALGTPARVEQHLTALLKHKDKGVAGMARTELNLVEVKKQPLALSFTGIDGKPVDIAQLRGKVIALYFWSSTNKGSVGNFEALKQLYANYKKRGLEIVTVSYDKAEDREKLAAAIKEQRLAWPVHYDGKGAKADFAAKLNITGVPALLVLDQKGMLQSTMQGTTLTVNLPVNQLEGQVKRLLGIK